MHSRSRARVALWVAPSVAVLGVAAAAIVFACGEAPFRSEFRPGAADAEARADGGSPVPPDFTSDPGDATRPAPPAKPCGNGTQEANEACDDGNDVAADGCSATCAIEPGWRCPTAGTACLAAACGDALMTGDEDCDDGNTTAADGCTATCVLEDGFKCGAPGTPCTRTTCGDNAKEGREQCDDGNVRPYDGCAPDCTLEPTCANGACTALCGDGVKFPGEACDDGNARAGDGCSVTCTKEPGFTCTEVTTTPPASIDVPVVFRDFNDTHPDFETYCCGLVPGMVKPMLDGMKKPELLSTGSRRMIESAATFAEWYRDVAGVNAVVVDKLTLTRQPDGSYVYDNASFFPLDGRGLGNQGRNHNFHFTSELRYWFTFQGGEVLDFRGDDDVFVFVNGQLAVDLGGVHGAEQGSVMLDATRATQLGLTVGGMYELVLFQAERRTTQSNYKLTLRGFVRARTTCMSVCGDGIKTKNEACDDGQNTEAYGTCGQGCVLGPRCGDGVLQGDKGEACDDGNVRSGDGCSSACQGEGPR